MSENGNCQHVKLTAGTTKVSVKVTGRNVWRGKPWGDRLKQTQRVRTWHVGADCSKYGQQQQGRPDHRRWTAVYDGHSATVRKQIKVVSGPRNQPYIGSFFLHPILKSTGNLCPKHLILVFKKDTLQWPPFWCTYNVYTLSVGFKWAFNGRVGLGRRLAGQNSEVYTRLLKLRYRVTRLCRGPELPVLAQALWFTLTETEKYKKLKLKNSSQLKSHWAHDEAFQSPLF